MSSMSSKAPRTSIVNSSPESTVVGGVRVLTQKRYSVRFALMCRFPFVAAPGRDSSTGDGMVQSGAWCCPKDGWRVLAYPTPCFEVGDLGQGGSGRQCCSRESTT